MKCCDLTSGLLRHQITIERETKTKDGVGGYSSSWDTHLQPYSYIKPVSGFERLQAMRLEASISHKIYIRYVADISPNDRIIFNSRQMQIRAIINIEERNKWLELTCDEGVVT